MTRWFELASGGVERRIFAARSRGVPSAEAEVLDVPAFLRLWDGVDGRVHLIIRSEKIRPIMDSAMMSRAERRRANGGGKNYHSS